MRILLLQDDTFFPPQAGWHRTDGTATILSDTAATLVLEQHFGLDLNPLRRVADADEGDARRMVDPWLWDADQSSMTAPATVPAERWAAAHALLAAQRAENELAWTTPAAMIGALTLLLEVLGPEDAPPDPALLNALAHAPLEVPVDMEDLGGGLFHQEIRDLLDMARWAELRGAARVRLWLK